ncbi:glycosyltransferase family 1 protein [Paenarthrobacter nitroguajacolicus]|uniref:Glycosyltransferase family 1 protein n=1 Tax=Paenarthrobacter nitroguajacolicus TaxID=211146 RepID=A0A558GMJ4_PAENT|nr:glycosyltransferase [Paenarthrobacter nitroguajacolicus]TVU58114.1 glycosyltransferase family 1 protein [Paenarthrobacter nitroguajacolicus]
MRVLMVTPGTRGDVAPMAGLGSRLQGMGYEVAIAANPAYAPLVVESGCEFRPLPGDLTELIRQPAPGAKAAGGSVLSFWRKLSEYMENAATGTLAAAEAGADVILANSVAPYAFDVAEAFGIPAIGAHLQPTEPSAAYPPVLMNSARSLGPLGNRIIGERASAGPAPYDAPSARLRKALGLKKETRAAGERRRRRAKAPILHGISPTVLPKPTDWHSGLVMAGYWWPVLKPDWQPSADLVDFLADGPQPVFVGFGSSAHIDPDFILESTRRAGVRAVVQGVEGVLGDDAIGIGSVPHEWLFPQMGAVVHHAGAGTTAAGLRAGVPTVGVPVYTDQPLWASRVAALGAGPAPIPYKKLTPERLGDAVKQAVNTPSYALRAAELGGAIAKEDGTVAVVEALRSL